MSAQVTIRMSAVPIVPDQDPPPSLMLVDDDPMWLMLTGQALRDRGYRVTECDRAEDALALLEAERPDLLVTDLMMPGMDGIEFCTRVRRHPNGVGLQVLMLTSVDQDEATRRAYEAGASDYCVKTVNWTLLANRIRQLLHVGRLERAMGASGPPAAAGVANAAGFEWQPASRQVRGSTDLFRMLDWSQAPASVRDRVLLARVSSRDRRRLRRAMAGLLTGGPVPRMEFDVTTFGGRLRRLRIVPHQVATNAGGTVEVSGLVIDCGPAIGSAGEGTQIHRLAHYDPLTGLPNRDWLLERLGHRDPAAAGRRRGVAILDIDRFRHVAEALGQAAGNLLLSEVGQRLRRLASGLHTARDAGGTAASAGKIEAVVHLAGAEFALLLRDVDDADAGVSICRTAIAALREPFQVVGRELFLRASMGVHVADADTGADDPAGWLGRADLARRAASGAGGDCALAFDATMAEAGFDDMEMERDLRYALKRGELSMHFQPQFAAGERRLVGFEALMRWERQGTMESAGRFIPLAEETGLIVPLGEWAIGEACAALAALRSKGADDCVMSVNLSCQQLRTGRLPAVLAAALAAHDVPAACLEVELTESGMMRDPEVAVAELGAIRALGAGLAVDDFGTGYSSLAYLTRLPLTTLKIDRSFVQDVHTSERSRAVARTIVALGANLQLRVVAEGVEDEAQRAALIDLGCDLQQGYLYSRAVPLDQALRIAERSVASRGSASEITP